MSNKTHLKNLKRAKAKRQNNVVGSNASINAKQTTLGKNVNNLVAIGTLENHMDHFVVDQSKKSIYQIRGNRQEIFDWMFSGLPSTKYNFTIFGTGHFDEKLIEKTLDEKSGFEFCYSDENNKIFIHGITMMLTVQKFTNRINN